MQLLSGTERDSHFLDIVVQMSSLALEGGYSPAAAILVTGEGETVAAYQSRRKPGNIFHAEYLALSNYFERLDAGHDLPTEGLTLYTTLEPCLMCAGIVAVGKVARAVWILDDLWAGAFSIGAYNVSSLYLNSRPTLFYRIDDAELRKRCVALWAEYLKGTGYTKKVLGWQCKS